MPQVQRAQPALPVRPERRGLRGHRVPLALPALRVLRASPARSVLRARSAFPVHKAQRVLTVHQVRKGPLACKVPLVLWVRKVPPALMA